jgi:hypothetical protein
MPEHFQIVHRFAATGIGVVDFYLLCLWLYASIRTGFAFFWVLVAAGMFYLMLCIISAALAFDLPEIQAWLGPLFVPFYEVFLALQPFALLLGAVGHTMLVRWLLRSQSLPSSPTQI